MGLEFTCPHCSQLVRTAESAAGKKGRCPHCRAALDSVPGLLPLGLVPAAAPAVFSPLAAAPARDRHSFVAAGFWHLMLLIFGSTRGGFEGTYRAVCFTAGSIALLNVLPIVGPLIGIVMGIVVLIHAFIHAHEASAGRVVAAVLIPYALTCCCALPGLLMLPALSGLRGF